MATTINLWTDALTLAGETLAESGAEIGGTWTYTGSLTPAPTAPVSYNGTADFAAVTQSGDYEFTYTVTDGTATDESIVTVTYGILTPRYNDECAGAYFLAGADRYPFQIIIEDNLAVACPGGCEAPTASAESTPTAWGAGPFDGDVWYRFTAPANDVFYVMIFTVDGSSYITDGITDPLIEIWYGSSPANCGAKFSATASSPNGSQTATATYSINASETKEIWIRIASLQGKAGKFTLNITTS